eukprot:TRINITY_DN6051_c0_g1_i2.p1 TRINITY_DN6051_c0_g1~~TRINITY_DN6051_c0_g1_i2.p1  ORF type:complete len:683 (+),score=179.16 TRINITY_DN6051_c0_g1_i2:88-2136(+)
MPPLVHGLLRAREGGFWLPGHRGALAMRTAHHVPAHFAIGAVGGMMWPRVVEPVRLRGAQGCVNTVQWSADGRLVIGGGDDTHLCVWDGANDWYMRARVPTGHWQNIFCARFVPGSADTQALSCARDGELRLTHIETKAQEVIYAVDQAEWEPNMSMHKFVLPTPQTVLTGSADGPVRLFDLRTDRQRSGLAEANVLVDGYVPDVNSVAVSPTRPYEFAVAGECPWVYIFDQRKIGARSKMTIPVGRLCGPELPAAPYGTMHITGCAYSHDGRHLAATYSAENVYVFDLQDMHKKELAAPQPHARRRVGYSGEALASPSAAASARSRSPTGSASSPAKLRRGDDDEDAGAAAAGAAAAASDAPAAAAEEAAPRGTPPAQPRRRRRQRANLWIGALVRISPYGCMNPRLKLILPPGRLATVVAFDEDDDPVIAIHHAPELPSLPSPRVSVATRFVELAEPAQQETERNIYEQKKQAVPLTGHCNRRTVKEVAFMGPHSEWVLSGSDDGSLFVWDWRKAEVEHIVRKADSVILNGIAPHPLGMCVLATCGIDRSVKVWQPRGGVSYPPRELRKKAYAQICRKAMGVAGARSYAPLRSGRASDEEDSADIQWLGASGEGSPGGSLDDTDDGEGVEEGEEMESDGAGIFIEQSLASGSSGGEVEEDLEESPEGAADDGSGRQSGGC